MTMAFSLEVAGVELTSATKAAFLNQASSNRNYCTGFKISLLQLLQARHPDPPTHGSRHCALQRLPQPSSTLLLWGHAALRVALQVSPARLHGHALCCRLQVSVLITPVLVYLSGSRVRTLEWAACMLGLVGSLLVAADSILTGAHGHRR